MPYRLLIIDDNEDILSSLQNYFSEKKYDVVSTSNGLDALKLLEAKKEKFNMVITDIVLPNISGAGIISIVKKKFPDIPVIAMTGWGEHPETLAEEAHADLILEKPIRLPDLEKSVVDLLSKKYGSSPTSWRKGFKGSRGPGVQGF